MKSLDDRYVKDLKKQAEDVDLMIERMDEQIKTLTKAYREELLQIEVCEVMNMPYSSNYTYNSLLSFIFIFGQHQDIQYYEIENLHQ